MTAPAKVTTAGTITLPLPRSAAASKLTIHSGIAPANTTFAYASDAARAASLPPSAEYRKAASEQLRRRKRRSEDDRKNECVQDQCFRVILASGAEGPVSGPHSA